MITALSPRDPIPDCPPLSIRMASFWEAYGGKHPFARFWRTPSGALSLVDGAATVIVGSDDDREEVAAFLAMLGPQSVLSNISFPSATPLAVYRQAVAGQGSAPVSPDYAAAYRRLSEAFTMPAWPDWYPDACHRVRHGAALLVQQEQGALFAACQGSRLLLTGLAVSPEYRRQGFASRLLDAVCVEGVREVYAIVQDAGAAAFYTHAGFENAGVVYAFEKGPFR